jgi:hypothetical protein
MSAVSNGRVEARDDGLHIQDLVVNDARACYIVQQAGSEAAVSTVAAMVRLGAQGLEAMIDARHLDFVREQVNRLLVDTEGAIGLLGDRLAAEADAKFDPARPGSYSQRIAVEVDKARGEISRALQAAAAQIKEDEARLRRDMESSLNPLVHGSATQVAVEAIQTLLKRVDQDFDPDNQNGYLARFTSGLDRHAAPGGPLEERLKEQLDAVRSGLVDELRALRDLIVHQQATRISKPAEIGDSFEAAVEVVLEQSARGSDGDWVENVTRKVGEATDAKAGDFDYHLGDGPVVAVEARSRKDRISLGGRGGVVEQLTKTRANRRADFAIYCVASEDALPDQVGYLQRYGDDRIVCCFGSHGEILALALKFARLCLVYRNAATEGLDAEQLRVTLEEMQRKVKTLGSVKRWCTNISESADKIRTHVGTVMIEVSELAERALAQVASSSADQTEACVDAA